MRDSHVNTHRKQVMGWCTLKGSFGGDELEMYRAFTVHTDGDEEVR